MSESALAGYAAAVMLWMLTLSFVEAVDDELLNVPRQHMHLVMAAAPSYRRLHQRKQGQSEVSRGGFGLQGRLSVCTTVTVTLCDATLTERAEFALSSASASGSFPVEYHVDDHRVNATFKLGIGAMQRDPHTGSHPREPSDVGERRIANKRRRGEAGQWHLESIKAVKYLSANEYAKLVQDCPTGHLLDATTEDAPRAGARRSLRRWLPPRAHRLPYMEHFVEQLHKDVAILLNTFASEWRQIKVTLEQQDNQVGNSSSARSPIHHPRASEVALAGPLALFVSIWKQLGWHAVQLHWSEEAETRTRFFEVTSRALLGESTGCREMQVNGRLTL